MERNINVWLPLAYPLLGTWPGTCPDWELNQHPFYSQVSALSTEPHEPGPNPSFNVRSNCNFNLF